MDHFNVEEDELVIPLPDLARDFWSRIAEIFEQASVFVRDESLAIVGLVFAVAYLCS